MLVSLIPIVTLAVDGNDRSMFGGAYVVDNYALALKAFFLVVTYVVILLSVDYIESGDYYRGEFYFLLLVSTLGLSVMASARDLITIFVALETDLDPDVHPRGVPQARPRLERSGREVLHHRRAVVGADALRHVADLRLRRLHAALRHLGVHHLRRHQAPARRGRLPDARRVRVQGERGAVPLLGARYVRRRADSRHRVPFGRVEGRRFRRPAQHHLLRLLRNRTASVPTCGGPRSGSSRPRR